MMGLRRSVRVVRVAEALDMPASQVRRLVAAGELEGHRVGKRGIRIYEDSLDEYRRRNATGPGPATTRPPPPRRQSGPTAAAREAMAALIEMGVFTQ